jgi:transposase
MRAIDMHTLKAKDGTRFHFNSDFSGDVNEARLVVDDVSGGVFGGGRGWVRLAVEPTDFRAGIDGLVFACRKRLEADPFSGALFVFANRGRTAIKILVYDGQGFWLCHKRLSSSKFTWWPDGADSLRSTLSAYRSMSAS